jgi:hypothetical protein
MQMFGEDSARGGSYFDIFLNDVQLSAIRNELKRSSIETLLENEQLLKGFPHIRGKP